MSASGARREAFFAGELTARAGVCHSLAKRAVRLAELDGLITVQRRPLSGRKHLTNIIRIIRAEWLDWLRKGRRKTYALNACNRAKPDFAQALEGYKITRHGHRLSETLTATVWIRPGKFRGSNGHSEFVEIREMKKPDLRGKVPESWACIDCGVNTAPGHLNREQMEQALALDWNNQGVTQTYGELTEIYMVAEPI